MLISILRSHPQLMKRAEYRGCSGCAWGYLEFALLAPSQSESIGPSWPSHSARPPLSGPLPRTSSSTREPPSRRPGTAGDKAGARIMGTSRRGPSVSRAQTGGRVRRARVAAEGLRVRRAKAWVAGQPAFLAFGLAASQHLSPNTRVLTEWTFVGDVSAPGRIARGRGCTFVARAPPRDQPGTWRLARESP